MKAMMSTVLAVSLTVIPSVAHGQMRLGTIELTLGAQRDDVLAAVRSAYRADRVSGESDQWIIMNRDGPPYDPLGTVSFNNGILVTISREWTPRDRESSQVAAVRAILSALGTLPSNPGATCRLVDRSNREPGYSLEAIEISCGAKRVSITVSRFDGTETYSVTEFLGIS